MYLPSLNYKTCVLRRLTPCCCRLMLLLYLHFSLSLSISTHLCVVCRHFCYPTLYVAISRPYVTCRNFTLLNKPYPKQPNPIKQAILYCIVLYHIIICTFQKTTMELDTHYKKYFLLHTREF